MTRGLLGIRRVYRTKRTFISKKGILNSSSKMHVLSLDYETSFSWKRREICHPSEYPFVGESLFLKVIIARLCVNTASFQDSKMKAISSRNAWVSLLEGIMHLWLRSYQMSLTQNQKGIPDRIMTWRLFPYFQSVCYDKSISSERIVCIHRWHVWTLEQEEG